MFVSPIVSKLPENTHLEKVPSRALSVLTHCMLAHCDQIKFTGPPATAYAYVPYNPVLATGYSYVCLLLLYLDYSTCLYLYLYL